MLESRFLSVLESDSVDSFRAASVKFARQLGFDFCSNIVVIDQPPELTDFISIDNLPAAYLPIFQNRDHGKRDPVSQHCKHRSIPIAWDQQLYLHAGASDIWERSAAFGLSHGIAVATHLPDGLHFMVGFERDQPLEGGPEEVFRLKAELQLYVAYAQETATRLLMPMHRASAIRPTLTSRELECLQWTMAGKTAWEVAQILGIAENTAIRHLHSATHKLGSASKHQAVLKALRAGLIR